VLDGGGGHEGWLPDRLSSREKANAKKAKYWSNFLMQKIVCQIKKLSRASFAFRATCII
jgi:hypothetical protein